MVVPIKARHLVIAGLLVIGAGVVLVMLVWLRFYLWGFYCSRKVAIAKHPPYAPVEELVLPPHIGKVNHG